MPVSSPVVRGARQRLPLVEHAEQNVGSDTWRDPRGHRCTGTTHRRRRAARARRGNQASGHPERPSVLREIRVPLVPPRRRRDVRRGDEDRRGRRAGRDGRHVALRVRARAAAAAKATGTTASTAAGHRPAAAAIDDGKREVGGVDAEQRRRRHAVEPAIHPQQRERRHQREAR